MGGANSKNHERMRHLSSVVCGCRLDAPPVKKVECGEQTNRIERVLVVSYRQEGERLFAMARDAAGPSDGPLFEIEIYDEWAKREILGLPVSPPSIPVYPKPSERVNEMPWEKQTPFQSVQQRHNRYKKSKR